MHTIHLFSRTCASLFRGGGAGLHCEVFAILGSTLQKQRKILPFTFYSILVDIIEILEAHTIY